MESRLSKKLYGLASIAEELARRDVPDLIASLIELHADEAVELEAENDEESRLRKRLSDLLEQTANALKGEPDLLHLHDWSDLPEVAKQLKAENDWLRLQLMEKLCDCKRHEEDVQATINQNTHDWSCPYRVLFRDRAKGVLDG